MKTTTPRTDKLASYLDLEVLEHDAYAAIVNHALGLERELAELKEAAEKVRDATGLHDSELAHKKLYDLL